MDVFSKISSSPASGNLRDLEEAIFSRMSDQAEMIELFKSRRDEFIGNYILKLEELLSQNDWDRVCSDVDSLNRVGDKKLTDESQSIHLTSYVLSDPKIVAAFNRSIEKEGKNWSLGLRRLFGKLMNQRLWGVAVGKIKIESLIKENKLG
jgi:hypothetical protein